MLNLLRDGVETDVGVRTDLIGGDGGHCENDGGGRAGDEVHDADAEGMEGGRQHRALSTRKRPKFQAIG